MVMERKPETLDSLWERFWELEKERNNFWEQEKETQKKRNDKNKGLSSSSASLEKETDPAPEAKIETGQSNQKKRKIDTNRPNCKVEEPTQAEKKAVENNSEEKLPAGALVPGRHWAGPSLPAIWQYKKPPQPLAPGILKKK